jgi:hypothetical protein
MSWLLFLQPLQPSKPAAQAARQRFVLTSILMQTSQHMCLGSVAAGTVADSWCQHSLLHTAGLTLAHPSAACMPTIKAAVAWRLAALASCQPGSFLYLHADWRRHCVLRLAATAGVIA